MKTLVTCAPLNKCPELGTIARKLNDPQGDNDFFPAFKLIYNAVLKQSHKESSNAFMFGVDGQSVTIKGHITSFGYIREIRKSLDNEFDILVTSLAEQLAFPDVTTAFTATLGNRTLNISEYTASNACSIFEVVSVQLVPNATIQWRKSGDAECDHIRNSIKLIINETTKVLMTILRIKPGFPLRFTELSILGFAGSASNIFIDSASKLFFIQSTYYKNRKYDK